jgi:hypothetical protein
MNGEVTGIIWTFGSLLATGLLIAVVAWPMSVIMRARIAEGREERYRSLAQAAVDAQRAADERLAGIATELATIRTHLADLQRVLREVE